MLERRSQRIALVAAVIAVLTPQMVAAADGSRALPQRAKGCTKVASTNGSDNGRGNLRSPYRTVGRLVSALRPGDVGCLMPGTYTGDVTIRAGGKAQRRVTLTSVARGRATIQGRVQINDSANYVTLTRLRIDGSPTNEQTVQVYGDDVVVSRNQITNRGKGGSCVYVGSREYGVAFRTVISRNRIHDCGATRFEHGIYVDAGRGGAIERNYIFDVPGWGIQLYKDADDMSIAYNAIMGAGESGIVFGGDYSDSDNACHSSDRNIARRNIFSFNHVHGVDEYWGCTPGRGNVVEQNCIWGNGSGPFDTDFKGYVQRRNRLSNPRFVDRGHFDFRLRRSSPCRAMGPTAR